MRVNVDRPYVVALFEHNHCRFLHIERKSAIDLGVLHRADDGNWLEDSDNVDLIDKVKNTKLPIVLRLGRDKGMVAFDTVPAQARSTLRQIVGHQLDTLTPWSPAVAVFDVLADASVAVGKLNLTIMVAPKSVVESAMSDFSLLGLTPKAVDIVVNYASEPSQFNLIRGDGTLNLQITKKHLLFGCGVITIVIGFFISFQLFDLERQLTDRRDLAISLRQTTSDLSTLQDNVNSLMSEQSAILLQLQGQKSVALALNAMSAILPDDVWLRHLEIDERKVKISGYASDAEILLHLIEGHEMFQQAQFLAANIPDQSVYDRLTKRVERFSISTQIVSSSGSETALAPPQ